ncbi:NUDIX domain-containing protein [Amycolatopsis thermoflava]|uniref:NUDIX domain-containing protein n=1 Tax=Amycolatopsis thermoflava TaxID=84480 RepID=UPI003EC0964D
MSDDMDRLERLAHTDEDPLTAKFATARLYAAQAEDEGGVSPAAAAVVMRLLGALREELDHIEVRMTEALLDAGLSWEEAGQVTGRTSRQAAQQRYRRLGGTRTWPTRRPARYAPVDHPGVAVPEAKRAWSVPWPDYAPVDITPPELRPAALVCEVPSWAEGYITPAEVPDWPQRQAVALVAFEFDASGRPLNPQGRTGRAGRNLGKWGENQAADPIVVAGAGAERKVLLITRDDIGVEAIPGGMVDPGETAPAALVRELREETGIDLADHQPVILGRQVVDDWRNTDHAWVASTSALYQLSEEVTATAGDDAADVGWFPFGSLDELEAAITASGRTLYAAHRPLLAAALEHLNQE